MNTVIGKYYHGREVLYSVMLVLGLGLNLESQVLVNLTGITGTSNFLRTLFDEGLSVRMTIFLFDKCLIHHCRHHFVIIVSFGFL